MTAEEPDPEAFEEREEDYELERPSKKIAKIIFIVGAIIVIASIAHFLIVEL